MKRHDDFLKAWKVTLPATLAGSIERMLWDSFNNRPIYAARAMLLESLLDWWIARETGQKLPHVPTLEEIQQYSVGNALKRWTEENKDAIGNP